MRCGGRSPTGSASPSAPANSATTAAAGTRAAARFGVNRHTVRGAIAALVQEGVLRAEQGRGTFIAAAQALCLSDRARTRFSEGLEGQARTRRGTCSTNGRRPADARTAEALNLAAGRDGDEAGDAERSGRAAGVARDELFDAARFAGIEKAYVEKRSMTVAFRRISALPTISGARR